jgi:hypothetical protein
MDMNVDERMESHENPSKFSPEHSVDAAGHHAMSAQMAIVHNSLEVMSSEAITRASFDHSKTLSACGHQACAQVYASTSPPQTGQTQPFHLHSVVINLWSPVNLLASLHPVAFGTPPPTTPALDLLPALRI